MNTQSNAMPGALGSQAVPLGVTTATRPIYWSLRRELWENRSIYMAPLIAAGVVLFGFLISAIVRPRKMLTLGVGIVRDGHLRPALATSLDVAAGMIMAAAFFVGLYYSLEALHGERRDRSILFWKSLPVSDLTTVLTKASVPTLILPLLSLALTVVTQSIVVALSVPFVAASGVSAGTLWGQLSLAQTWTMLLYHMLTVHALWHAPIYGWLLLVSAWARRAPVLWAVLPPLAICAVEKIAFNTTHFCALLIRRFTGGPEAMTMGSPGMSGMGDMTHATPLQFLSTPGLWIGLALAAAFLVAAARVRRSSGPI